MAMKLIYLQPLHKRNFTLLLLMIAMQTTHLVAQNVSFGAAGLLGETTKNPTSLDFGPDGKLYVAQQDGIIWQYTVSRDEADPGSGSYSITTTEEIDIVQKNIQNHTDDGTSTLVKKRQVTGILAAGTAETPILYVSSSDNLIGGGGAATDKNLDTNSGVLSKLTWNGTIWNKIDLVRGLPRCEENHSTNGMDIFERDGQTYMLLQQGGHANMGAPSNNFAGTPEYFLSGALLIVNLTQLDTMPIYTDPRSNTQYVYDLPTINDPEREDIDNTHLEFPYPFDHPMYTATIDLGDPFGGDDGLNQAFAEPGGPVQIFAPGFRNAFDVVIREDGSIYSFDNGPNSSWGGLPLIYDSNDVLKGTESTTTYLPENGDYITNELNESGTVTHSDALHNVGTINDPNGTYYAGHPRPIAAFPSKADLITYKKIDGNWEITATYELSTTLVGVSGYFNPSFSMTNFPDDPRQGKYLADKINSTEVNILDLISSSTNGICEYTASNFNGVLQGSILSASFNGNIYRHVPNASGTGYDVKEILFSGFGSVPLDVIALPDDHIFAGTVWATTYGSDNVTIFEPSDSSCILENEPGFDPAEDYDNDGYTNQDELDNGTNFCSAGSTPNDHDGDLVSDLNDLDDDDDGIPDLNDAFAIDPTNGLATNLPVLHPFWNNDPGTGFFGLGFTGLLLDPSGGTDYLTQYNPENMSFGGAAGKAAVDLIPNGTAFEGNNSQEYAFQFGVDVNSNTNAFTVQGRVESPFFGINGAATAPIKGQAVGIFVGNGDQDNYLKIALQNGTASDDTMYGIAIQLEEAGISTSNQKFDIPDILSANAVDFYISINPALNEAFFFISLDGGQTLLPLGTALTLPSSFLDATDAQGLAVGIIATSFGATEAPFSATWDFINITEDLNGTITPSTTTIDFGALANDDAPSQYMLELQNQSGPANPALTIDEINFTGTHSALFSTTGTPPISIGSGSQLNLPIEITPDGEIGTKNATLEIVHSGANSPLLIPLIAELTEDIMAPVFRINAGGPAVSATDDGPDWRTNMTLTDGVGFVVNTGNSSTGNLNVANKHSSIPGYIDDATYTSIFKQERWDVFSSPEMEFTIPLPNDAYEVNIYLGNSYIGTDEEGDRIFDILIEGEVVKDNLDLITEFGHNSGGLFSFPVTVTDGELNIAFGHETENPLVNAIEILGTSELVYPINITPIADQSNAIGSLVDITVGASGGDSGKNFTYSIEGQPDGIAIEPTNGLIFGTIAPTAISGGIAHDGVHEVTITVSQPDEEPASITFAWTVTDPANAAWIDLEESENYTARHECSFVQAGDHFFLMGGRENTKSIDSYNYETNTWTTASNVAPKEYNHFQAITYKGLIWIIGAFEDNNFPNETPADHIQLYNPITQQWIEGIEIPEDRRRGGAGVVLHNDKFYIVGGNTIGHNGGYTAMFDEYDPATGIWTVLADAPRERDHFHAGIVGNKLYAAGGRLSGGVGGVFEPLVEEVDVYDFDTNTWSSLAVANNIPTPRAGTATAVFNEELYIIGGEGINVPNQNPDPAFDTVEAYNPVSNSWSTKASLNHPRHGTQALVSGNGIFITAGSYIRGGSTQKNMEAYNANEPVGTPAIASTVNTPDSLEFNTNETTSFAITTTGGTLGTYIESMVISGEDAEDFEITSGLLTGALLDMESTHPIEISYLANELGKTAVLTITYNGGETKVISLTGKVILYRVNAGGTTIPDEPLVT